MIIYLAGLISTRKSKEFTLRKSRLHHILFSFGYIDQRKKFFKEISMEKQKQKTEKKSS